MSAEAAEARVIPEWSLGDRLRKVRRVTGMSQAEFAAQLGRNQKTYASWELDMTAPRNVVAVAKRIEAMTGVPAGWLLDTEVSTRWYPSATSSPPAILTLVSDTIEDNRAVADCYGSSAGHSGYGGGRSITRSAGSVNNADAA